MRLLPLIVSFVLPRLTFIPLLSNALFHWSKFSLKSSMLFAHHDQGSSAYRISFILPFHAFSVTSPPSLQTKTATAQSLGVHQLSQIFLQTTLIQLWYSFSFLHKDSSPPWFQVNLQEFPNYWGMSDADKL